MGRPFFTADFCASIHTDSGTCGLAAAGVLLCVLCSVSLGIVYRSFI